MAKPWDNIMKWLVEANAKHFVNWLVANAVFVRARDVELKPEHRFADALLEVLIESQPALIEIEFQTKSEKGIEERLLEYNFLATRQYELPAYSYLIYLRQGGTANQHYKQSRRSAKAPPAANCCSVR
jgi:hypothetical protein